MFKRRIPADRLHKAADLLREQEICEQASSMDELRLALPQDVLESSRIRAWNGIRAELEGRHTASSKAIKARTKAILKRMLTAAAVMVLVLGMTMVVSADVRRMISDFINYSDNYQVEYLLEGANETVPVVMPHLNADKYYDGFELKKATEHSGYIDEYYINDSTGDVISFTCSILDGGTVMGVLGNPETRESVLIHGFSGDLYHATETVRENTLVWIDNERNMVFMIDSTLSISDLYDMVDLIYQ